MFQHARICKPSIGTIHKILRSLLWPVPGVDTVATGASSPEFLGTTRIPIMGIIGCINSTYPFIILRVKVQVIQVLRPIIEIRIAITITSPTPTTTARSPIIPYSTSTSTTTIATYDYEEEDGEAWECQSVQTHIELSMNS